MDVKEAIDCLVGANYDEEFNEYDWNDAMVLAIEALERTRWIPVTERLPDIFSDVLVSNFGYVEIAYLNVKAKWIQKGVQDGCLDGATHWMQLPKPPEVE